MSLKLRAYILDQDQPLETGEARQVACDVLEVHGAREQVLATIVVEYRERDDLPSLSLQLRDLLQRVTLLSAQGAVLYGTNILDGG